MSTHFMVEPFAESQERSPLRSITPLGWFSIVMGAICLGLLLYGALGHHGEDTHHEPHLPRWWGIGILPFVGILGSIAFLPLLKWTHHWWENNLNRLAVSMFCAGLTLVYVLFAEGAAAIHPVLEHAIVAEYIPFIVLLFALYVISGGIRLTGDLAARPIVNTGFLAIGAGLASFIGTTGASMLLIRPLLETNIERKHVLHTVVFFIFLVSNIGGTLLPIGDPPLFLGYLRGVDFFWTFTLTPQWALTTTVLLIIYYIWDTRAYRREEISSIQRDALQLKPLRVRGLINIIWMAGVVASVAFVSPEKPLPFTNWTPFLFMREILMLLFVGLSLATTPRGLREANKFNYHAILEVAALFIGIFIAMQIPVQVLHVMGPKFGLDAPWQYFWLTGSLSSFLDNAPTYVVFFETAGAGVPTVEQTVIPEPLLIGISLGAVFMGAMTYIGNGPNFMVKSIAEQTGIRMPSFFGFLFKYSIPILVPVFIVLVTFLFLCSWSPFAP